MQTIVTEDYAGLSTAGADVVAAVLARKPDATLVLATGDTPMGVYRELAERHRRGELDTSKLRAFQLDAYLGLAPDDPRALFRWLKESFIDPLEITADRVIRLQGDASDPEAACRAFDAAIDAAGGVDLSILGLGPNGHLGFNEPPVTADAPTREIALTPESITSNARYWGGEVMVPRHALTTGMSTLLAARATLLVVSGDRKRDILRKTLEEPINTTVPASYLQAARNVIVVADRAALPRPTSGVSRARS